MPYFEESISTFLNTEDIIQLLHTFMCNSQNYHTRGDVDDPMALLLWPRATVPSGHPQHLRCDSFVSKKLELVVLKQLMCQYTVL